MAPVAPRFVAVACPLVALALAAVHLVCERGVGARSWLASLVALLSLSLAAAGLLAARHLLIHPGEASAMPSGPCTATGVVHEVRRSLTNTRFVLGVEAWSTSGLRVQDRPGTTASGRAGRTGAATGAAGRGGVLWVTAEAGVDARRGDRVRVAGQARVPRGLRNPGGFDFASWLKWRGIRRTLRASRVELLKRSGGVERVAEHVERAVDRNLRGRSAALLRALLLGRTDGLEQEFHDDFRTSGTVHVLAVSGLHVGFVVLIVASLARAVGMRPRGALCAALAGAVCFAALVGPRASVIRAVIMVASLSGARLCRRRGSTANALGLAALVLLLARPGTLFDLGFRLSFGAVAGILLIAPVVVRGSRAIAGTRPVARWARGIVQALGVSVGAQLGTLPALVLSGSPVAPLAPLGNLVVVPLAAFTVATGTALCALDRLAPAFAALMSAAAGGALRLMALCVETSARLVGGARVPLELRAPAVLAAVAVVALVRPTRRARLVGAALIGLTVLVGWLTLSGAPGRGTTRLVFFDVGQGDALLLEVAGGPTVLVDAGPASRTWDAGRGIVLPYLDRRADRMVDLLVVTHGHADHTGGAPSLIREGVVGALAVPTPQVRGDALSKLVCVADSAGVPTRPVAAGDTLVAEPGCTLLVLWPPAAFRGDGYDENGRSVVLEARLAGIRLLAGGDIEERTERTLRARGALRRTDILKVSHHGSSTSTSAAFVAATRPSLAVISVGARNRFGHPDPGAVDRLERAGAVVLRTDRDGAVIVDIGKRGALVRTVASGKREWVYRRGPTTTSVSSSGRMICSAARRTSSAVIDEMISPYLSS